MKNGSMVTFDNDDAAGFVGTVAVGGDATVLATVLGFAVNDFHEHDSIRV